MGCQEESLSPEQSWLISSPGQWTPSGPDLTEEYLDLTTLYLDKVEQVITGLRDTTPKELNLLIPFSMLSERRLKVVTACKVSNLPILWEEVLALEWELFSSQK